MSFKRDGDDKCALNIQRKRRVDELLYEDIHDGEVSKMKNGRYVCKVCPYAPTFDTVNMYQVHKQGKKHQNSLEYQENKKQELQDLIIKRQQEQEIQIENQSKKIPNEESRPSPYQFLMKKSRSNPHKRKMAVELSTCTGNRNPSVDTTPAERFPGQRRSISSINFKAVSSVNSNDESEKKDNNYQLHANEKKDDFITAKKLEERPNVKRMSNYVPDDGPQLKSSDLKKFINQGGESHKTNFYFSRRQQNNSNRTPNIKLDLERHHVAIENHTSVSWDRFKQMKGKHFVAPVRQIRIKSETVVNNDQVCSETSDVKDGVISVNTPATDQTVRAQEFLNAFGAGWKRDWDGKWIRDEEAEFDSDEEPPNIT